MLRVLIAGGGTGGHVFPMVAVGDALRKERPDLEVTFVGTGRGIEARVIPAQGDVLERLEVLPLRGKGLKGFLRGALRAAMTLPEARALVKRVDPDVVFSVGGYAAGPVTLAAWSRGVPVTLMEPNAVLGFTNRILSRFIRRAYVGFPETHALFSPEVARWTGVPLRQRFEPAPPAEREVPRVLVMGGSQGALALNETLPRAFAACREQGLRFEIVHQTGRDKDEQAIALYQELGLEAEVVPFIDDVAGALAAANLVVERAGAGSLAELTAIGRPAILIPYPYAADDHQRENAASLARRGGARCVVQAEATVDRLTTELGDLLGDQQRLRAMAEASAAEGRPDAAYAVARDLIDLAEGQATPAVSGRARRPVGDALRVRSDEDSSPHRGAPPQLAPGGASPVAPALRAEVTS